MITVIMVAGLYLLNTYMPDIVLNILLRFLIQSSQYLFEVDTISTFQR